MHECIRWPRRRLFVAFAWFGCAGLWACPPSGPERGAEAVPQAPAPGAAAAVTAVAGERPATAGDSAVQSEAYVTQATFVRRAPSEAREVEVPGKTRRQPNWMATLQRGEHVRVLEAREAWLRVQSSDEAAGWIKRDGVLVGPEVAQATNLATLQRFTRPDLLALVPTRPIEPGSLLFVLRRKEGFCEVNFAGSAASWVLADALERDPNEVEAAKLVHRARQLQERNDAGAEALLALARQRFAATRLMATLFAPPTPSPAPPDVAADADGLAAGPTPSTASTPDAANPPGGAWGGPGARPSTPPVGGISGEDAASPGAALPP